MPETHHNSTEPESNLRETLERVGGILRRRRWWIIGGSCLIPLAVIAVALELPNHYISQATLLVVQPQVSQRYVQEDNPATMSAAVQAMKLQVLSRSRLLGIISDLGLYGADKNNPSPDLADRMRSDVDIEPLDIIPGRIEFNALIVSFTAGEPQLAQEVTRRLAALFIEQNQKSRGEQAANTTKFLSDQLEAARQRLAAQDQRLQAFRSSNMGELPEEQQPNLAGLTDARMRLETIASNLALAQQQQASLELSLGERLVRLKSEKDALLVHYTPLYPQVKEKDQEIAKVQAVLDRLKAGAPSSGPQRTEPTDDPTLDLIIRQAESNAEQMANLQKQQEKAKQDSEQYQARLTMAPLREQQLSEILRDDDLYKQAYASLLNNKLQSQMATSVEENQEGQQFRLVDPANLPGAPSGPNRVKIALGGLGGGIFLGIALAVLTDLRDSSFHNEKALSRTFAVPLVMGVPLVRSTGQVRLQGLRIAAEGALGGVMAWAVYAAEMYVFRNS